MDSSFSMPSEDTNVGRVHIEIMKSSFCHHTNLAGQSGRGSWSMIVYSLVEGWAR